MTTISLLGDGRITNDKGAMELEVPHLDERLTWRLPLFGPGYHGHVMKSIDEQKQLRPTTAQVFSLVDLALRNLDVLPCAEVIKRLKNKELWTATESVAFPGGHIVYDNVDGTMPEDSASLVKMHDRGDLRVRIVPPGFGRGYFSLKNLVRHPVLIAHIGERMIPIAERIFNNLYGNYGGIWASDYSELDCKRETSIYHRFIDEGIFWLDSSQFGTNANGHAAGILKKKD